MLTKSAWQPTVFVAVQIERGTRGYPHDSEGSDMTETATKAWLTVHDAAAHANVCRDTIYDACERGELRHVRVSGRRAIRMRAEWIDEWLARYTTTVAERTERRHV
jgi:excisionase family DNA binding protein